MSDIEERYQDKWDEATRLADEITRSYPLEKYNPESLGIGDKKIAINGLELLVEKMRSKPKRAEKKTATSSKETTDVPSRYQKLWSQVNSILDEDAQSYCLDRYHPNNHSAGSWRTTIGQLEQILSRERKSTNEFKFSPSTVDSLRALSRSDLVTRRLESVIDSEATELSTKEIVSDNDQLVEWLQVRAVWESLQRAPAAEQEAISVLEIPRLEESTAVAVEDAGYETFQDIRAADQCELTSITGIDKQTAKDLRSWVCFRPVSEIQGVTPPIHQQLNNHGLWFAADITATSVKALTNIGGVDEQQARQIKARAGAWLPPKCTPPECLREQFSPPYESLDTAQQQLLDFERVFYIHSEIAPRCEHLIASDLETPNKETIYSHIYNQYPESHTNEETGDDLSWVTVLERLVSLAHHIEASFPTSVRGRFDVEPLPEAQINVSTLCAADTPSSAIEEISSVNTLLQQNSKFKQLAASAESVHEVAEQSERMSSTEFERGLSRQLSIARACMKEGYFNQYYNYVDDYLTACHRSFKLDHTYESFSFNSLLPALVDLGQQELPTSDFQEITKILKVSETALDFLDQLDYDHPAVDAESWKDSIEVAIEEQHFQILKPVENQLTRFSEGVWTAEDLSTYDWREFEHLIGNLYRDKGFEVEVTQSTGDLGVDVWVNDEQTHTAVQVKHHQLGTTVGREPLQKLVSSLAKGDADQAEVVTSAKFADTATKYADDFGPKLTLIPVEELITRLSESRLPPPT